MFQLLLLFFLLSPLQAEVFTSVQDLTHAFTLERNLMGALSEYLIKTEAKLDRIKKYLREYEQVRSESKAVQKIQRRGEDEMWETELSETLAANPIHAYQLMKRLTLDWKHIQGNDPYLDWKGVEEALTAGDTFGLSQLSDGETDLQGSAQAILRLQDVYQLNTTSLVHGNILGIQTSAELTSKDCLYLGKNSFNNEEYSVAVEWFDHAYTLAGMEKNQTVTQQQVLEFLNKAIEMLTSKLQKTKNERIGQRNLEIKQEITAKKSYKLYDEISDEDAFSNFKALCRGEQLLNDSYVAKLTCFYDTRKAPYLTLMPAKVELKHIDPEIIVFHDAITDDEIIRLREFASPQLTRGMIQGPEPNGSAVISDVRISKVAWIDGEEEMASYKNLYYRMNYYTGLSVDTIDGSAEQMQICNYGIGGHYIPHRDYFYTDEKKQELLETNQGNVRFWGDRMATFMFYLSDVSRGGATAFSKYGVSIFPKKGSAAFWYNLKKSGGTEPNSLHGGCPVLHGSKWVSNKWIRERRQFNRRLCGLSEHD